MTEEKYQPKRSGQAWITKGDDIDWRMHYVFRFAATDEVANNDIAHAILKKSILLKEWFLDRSQQEQETLRYLIEQCSPYIGFNDNGKPYLVLNMNDFFYPCADAEDVPESEYENLCSLLRDYPVHGETAWVSSRRGGIAPRQKRDGWDEALKAALNLQKAGAR